jgi:nicotinamide-nucleotide amidase
MGKAKIEEEIGALLRQSQLTLGVVESATGGLISHRITNVPGSSDYYKGSVTAYSNDIKLRVVGVKKTTLSKYGAVSAQTAAEMAEGGRRLLAVDICLSDTGIAGPGGATPEKPVGLFYLGLSSGQETRSERHVFSGTRRQNKQQAAETALKMLRDYLLHSRSSSPPGEARLEERQVVTCFLLHRGKILILRRSEQVGTYRGRWAGVSGYVERTPDEQAFIEIEEETGLSKEDIELLRKGAPLEVLDGELGRKWVVHPFLFRVKDRSKLRIDWEHKESRWISPGDLIKYQTVPMLKEALERVL